MVLNPAWWPNTGDAASEGGEAAGAPLGGTSVVGSKPWLSLGCFKITSVIQHLHLVAFPEQKIQ